MIIKDTNEKYTLTQIDHAGPSAGQCTIQVVKPDGSIDTTKSTFVINLDFALMAGIFKCRVDDKEKMRLDALEESLNEIRDEFMDDDCKEMQTVTEPDTFSPANILIRQTALKDGFDKAVSLMLENVDKSRKVLKIANHFINEFDHAARSSFAEPMDHDDCKRFAKAFGRILL